VFIEFARQLPNLTYRPADTHICDNLRSFAEG
jgi:hypothetical protein